jgi:hypothetical protein
MGMDTPNDLIDAYAGVITEHGAWLQRFGKQRLKKWEDLLKNYSEAAICEAETRKLLSGHNVDVQPHEDLSHGGPDFLCSKDDKTFYVEATCITIDVATKKTALLQPKTKAQYHDDLTEHIHGELRKKTRQCSELKLPCIVAIATLHAEAGRLCFDNKLACEEILTGTTQIAVNIDIQKGRFVGKPYQTTNLENSAFIRFTKQADGTIEYARNPISAVLLCPFGRYSLSVRGLLHPKPNYPFDRLLLPNIEFAKLTDGYQNGGAKVEWI